MAWQRFVLVVAVTAIIMTARGPLAQIRESARPSLLLSATTTGVLDFAGAALANDIPVGVVAPKSVRNEARRPPTRTTEPADLDMKMALDRFNDTHPDYVAELSAGLMFIRERAVPLEVSRLLTRRHSGVSFVNVPSFSALMRVGDLLALQPDLGGGYIGTEASNSCHTRVPVTMTGNAPTTRQLLDGIAKQAVSGWVMFFDLPARSDTLELGLLCSDGSYTYSTVRGW